MKERMFDFYDVGGAWRMHSCLDSVDWAQFVLYNQGTS